MFGFLLWLFPALPETGEGCDDTVQRAQLLLGALRALKQAAQMTDHVRTAFRMAQEAAADQLFFEVDEKIEQFILVCGPGAAAAQDLRRRCCPGGEPLIADNHNRLREVERRESGVERHG